MVAGADDIRHARYDTARVAALIREAPPEDPVFLFRPEALTRRAETFKRGFPGHVSYAVKANPSTDVLDTLVRSGVTAFDVASVAEMRAVRECLPDARLHYHNPIRSAAEIAEAKSLHVASWSVDRLSELDKLGALPPTTQIAVRVTLNRGGAAYDFGTKFGAGPDMAVALLKDVSARGLSLALTFHPGTQCTDPHAWTDYIAACALIARQARFRLAALNVGGGFPSREAAEGPVLAPIFDAIRSAIATHFPDDPPTLWCEPGRAMVADAAWLLLRVKARCGHILYLNDGLYGALGEWRDMPVPGQRSTFGPQGVERGGNPQPFTIFGPTCDSLDRVPGTWELPSDIAEGDHILIRAAGAYSTALVTAFNGYGTRQQIDLRTVKGGTGQGRLAG
ncbi:type III PLP-dependent enzyme [Marivita hallyeonensis]|uniref:ornithine decarboxylase n=1 Tax=Marivita hallyeonensis TaxID=996342 RepID=A0A1M5P6L2_9RHOB|nr:type III PLP-dependent enzyme [Marivita hallyeonensis]SHG97430.1 ornithine decarboxylase [Marivita hallyeonensis]